ncbi:MAG: ThuA domain-containing protein [Phycisphaerae bacterium]
MRRTPQPWLRMILWIALLLPGAARGQKPPDGVTDEQRQATEQAIPATAPARPAKARRLLVVDLNVGRPGHRSIPHANLAVRLMGERTGAYETTVCHDRSMLAPERLARFDAVFLNNTLGPIFHTPALRQGFAAYISGGGGLVANHAVTVTSTDWPAFGEILGARGAAHRDADEKVTVKLDDPDSPLTAMFDRGGFTIADEIFRFHEPYSRRRVHVLLSVDTDRTDMTQGGRPRGRCVRPDNDYPVSWIRRHGKGRVFYCSLGHNPHVFRDGRMLQHFLAGIQFALGDLEADATPSAHSPATPPAD